MKRIAVVLTGAALALTFATSAHAGSNHGSTSTTCPPKQTTTTSSVPATSTSLPSTSTTVPETSTSTVATTTTAVEATTTTVEATTTTVPNESTTTALASTTTVADTTTSTVLDDVKLIPPLFISQGDTTTELPNTGFPYRNVTVFALGVIALGWSGLLLRKIAARS